MNLPSAMGSKLVFLLCLFHKNGIDGARTLISQSSKYRVTNGQTSSLLLRCAASGGDKDYGHKVNMGSGECSAGDSSNPETGFTYIDKTDMIQLFSNGVSIIICTAVFLRRKYNRYVVFGITFMQQCIQRIVALQIANLNSVFSRCAFAPNKVVWPSSLRRWFKTPVSLGRGFEYHRCQDIFFETECVIREHK